MVVCNCLMTDIIRENNLQTDFVQKILKICITRWKIDLFFSNIDLYVFWFQSAFQAVDVVIKEQVDLEANVPAIKQEVISEKLEHEHHLDMVLYMFSSFCFYVMWNSVFELTTVIWSRNICFILSSMLQEVNKIWDL